LPIAAVPSTRVPTNLLVYKGAIPLLDGGVRLAQLSLSPVVVFKLPAIS
jgi:hypothetical protein